VTDRSIISEIEYHLIEPQGTTSGTYAGTDMFTFPQIVSAVERARNQFIADTGVEVSQLANIPVSGGTDGRIVMPERVIAIRRAAWRTAEGAYTVLNVSDERVETAIVPKWSLGTGDTPRAMSILVSPQLTLQLMPAPLADGVLELLVVQSPAELTPDTAPGTVLGIPDDYSWAVKWKAIAILLSSDGPARDPFRAEWAEKLYQLGMGMAKLMPVVLHAELNGIPILISSMFRTDQMTRNWQGKGTDTPTKLSTVSPNLIALTPTPDGTYSVTLDVITNTPVYADSQYPQIGREQTDAILGCALQLATFKSGGGEMRSSAPRFQNFIEQVAMYLGRRTAAAQYMLSTLELSTTDDATRPYAVAPDSVEQSDPDEIRAERNARRRGVKR
jgi:hypothetical protein